ncbi:MAG TPA: hypothetical protein VGL13_07895 [Polyangiaceae bacterium]
MKRLSAVHVALCLFAAVLATACGGAKHARFAGPPPEYEPPEPWDSAAPPISPALSRADGGAR